MRRTLPIVLSMSLVWTATVPAAQRGSTVETQRANPTITLTGQDIDGVPVSVNNKLMGMTDRLGKLPYNPSLLAGKPMITVVIVKCPNKSDNSLNLFGPTVAANVNVPKGCSDNKAVALFIWGDSVTISFMVAGPATTTPTQGEESFFSKPFGLNPIIFWGGIAAGVVVIAVVASGGSSTTNGGGTTTGTETRSFSTALLRTFSGSWSLISATPSGCFSGGSITITISGSATATAITITEGSVVFVLNGATQQNTGTNAYHVVGAGSGSSPALGFYTGALDVVEDVNTTHLSGTYTTSYGPTAPTACTAQLSVNVS